MTDRFSAIISGVDGIADCSAYLASTVTVDSLLVTKRITCGCFELTHFDSFTSAAPIEDKTITFTETATVTETAIASTEALLFVTSSTITASTETEFYTSIETSYETPTSTTTGIVQELARRVGSSISLPSSLPSSAPAYPAYASAVCPSWENYVAACACARVSPTTVTVISETITVNASSVRPSPAPHALRATPDTNKPRP